MEVKIELEGGVPVRGWQAPSKRSEIKSKALLSNLFEKQNQSIKRTRASSSSSSSSKSPSKFRESKRSEDVDRKLKLKIKRFKSSIVQPQASTSRRKSSSPELQTQQRGRAKESSVSSSSSSDSRQRNKTYQERTSRSAYPERETTAEAQPQRSYYVFTDSGEVYDEPSFMIPSSELTSEQGAEHPYFQDILPVFYEVEGNRPLRGCHVDDDDDDPFTRESQANQDSAHGGVSDRYSESFSPVDRMHHDEISSMDVSGPFRNNQDHEETLQIRIENIPFKGNGERTREVAVSSSRERTLNVVSQISMELNEMEAESVRTESQTNDELMPEPSQGTNLSGEASEEYRFKNKEDIERYRKKMYESFDDSVRNNSKKLVKIFPSTSKKSDSDDQGHRFKLGSSKKTVKSSKKIIRKRHSSDSSNSSQR
ncbi:UNVERIFIED_CONTAM: hypothetical protein NCL1_29510 [Trichonephila clavipes]